MLMPQMIDTLNRNHAASITHLEGLARDIHALQQLADTLAGSVTDISAFGGGFTVCLAIDIYWATHRAELAALLHDYQYTTPLDRNHQRVISMHREMPLALLIVFRMATA